MYNNGVNNIGHFNFGVRNIGWFNYGDHNIGYFNHGSYNIGVFNVGFSRNKSLKSKSDEIWYAVRSNLHVTKHYTGLSGIITSSGYIKYDVPLYMFNKKSTWTMGIWNKSKARQVLRTKICCDFCDFIEYKDINTPQDKWNKLSEDNKNEILSLPNFNAKIFEQITGIKVK